MESQTPQERPEVLSPGTTFTPQTLLLGSLLVTILALAIAFFLNKRNLRSKGTDILLLGAPDAGKTSIMTALVHDQTIPTHASMQTNSSVYVSGNKTFRVIDVPGHPRIRNQFQEYLPNAKAIAFVVDAGTISRNGAMVAEHLHNVLHSVTSLPPSQKLPSILIVAHKADVFKTGTSSASQDSVAITRVKIILERELEKRRASQSGGVAVEGLGQDDEKTEMGGLECGDGTATFKFDDWEGGEVAFVSTHIHLGKPPSDKETNEKDGDDGLSELHDWLANNM